MPIGVGTGCLGLREGAGMRRALHGNRRKEKGGDEGKLHEQHALHLEVGYAKAQHQPRDAPGEGADAPGEAVIDLPPLLTEPGGHGVEVGRGSVDGGPEDRKDGHGAQEAGVAEIEQRGGKKADDTENAHDGLQCETAAVLVGQHGNQDLRKHGGEILRGQDDADLPIRKAPLP
ncbi:hypothetical protein SDC9_100975 [bioreactor metagenome]|uniref:Uncharacterized protein n=1 Tax=bioreactor metagenome TaxID=1076179 RepID=A0A645APF9_9ZZZZ